MTTATNTAREQIRSQVRFLCTDNDNGYWDSEDADWDLEELFDALQEFAPPFFYFGAHPGDGSDYGFWFCEESFQEAAQNRQCAR